MMTKNWFDRKFDSDIPATAYPDVYARLQQAPGRLQHLSALPDAVLNHQPGGKWSVKEHVGHLVLLEELWQTRIGDIANAAPQLTTADLQNIATTQAGFNDYDITILLQRFADVRSHTLALLSERAATTHTSMHPRLQQPMRLIDHMYFVAEHDEHHIDAITTIIALS